MQKGTMTKPSSDIKDKELLQKIPDTKIRLVTNACMYVRFLEK